MMRARTRKRKRVVVIGGGTGTFTVLTGLKAYPIDITAVVAMADDGGSTGILRDELGVLPPGDVRQCLVALSHSDLLMRELMNYRFAEGRLAGHNFGNLLLSALEKATGSFDEAIERAGEILRIEGTVVPATLTKTRLVAYLTNRKTVHGERAVSARSLRGLMKIVLEPPARANPKAVATVRSADCVVIAPGDFYSSIIPNFLVTGIKKAFRETRGQKVYVCNLMTKKGHTDGFTVRSFVEVMERRVGCRFDRVIYNNSRPSGALLRRYAREGEKLVEWEPDLGKDARFLGADLVSMRFPKRLKGDPLKRNLIRHNPQRLAAIITSLL